MSRRKVATVLAGLLGVATGVTGVLAGSAPPAAGTSSAWTRQGNGFIHHASPTLADVNGDGTDDVIQTGRFGAVYVKDGATGNDMPGWPREIWGAGPTQSRPSASESAVSVGDIDNDGENELVVSALNDRGLPQVNGGMIAFNRNGSVKWSFQMPDRYDFNEGATDKGRPDGVISTPALGDVDGDGVMDVVFGGWDHYLHALDGKTGKELPGFPYDNGDTIWGSPALYDTDKDGRMEIFIGTDIYDNEKPATTGGKFNGFKYNNGYLYSIFPFKQLGEAVWSSPSIGDIDGDGRLEAVMATGWHWAEVRGWSTAVDASRKVFAFHLDDGSAVPGWPVTSGSHTWGSPALADLDGDGKQEVILGNDAGKLRAWRGNGSVMWEANVGPMTHNSPLVADMDGYAGEEVVAPTGWGTYILDGRTGAQKRMYSAGSMFNTNAIGKTTGGWQLITARDTSVQYANMDRDGKWELATHPIPTPTKTPSWPQFRKNARHLGADATNYPVKPQPATVTMYNQDQVVSANGSVRLWLQGDGNLVATKGADPYVPFWSLESRGSSNRLVTQKDGNVVLYTANGGVLWSTGTAGNPGARLVVQNDGNMVVYSDKGKALWGSGTYVPAESGPIGSLQSGECAYSGNKAGVLCMQRDGNLVKYVNGVAKWGSGTEGNTGAFLVMQKDGNMVVYTPAGKAKWGSGTEGNSGARLILYNDGQLKLITTSNKVAWYA